MWSQLPKELTTTSQNSKVGELVQTIQSCLGCDSYTKCDDVLIKVDEVLVATVENLQQQVMKME